ncbi:MAG: hypothetical protein RR734_01020 [Bacilli bacterium]
MSLKNCKICFKPIRNKSLSNLLFDNITICYDCYLKFLTWFKTIKYKNVSITFIYQNNEYIRNLLYQLCKSGDVELGSVFLTYFETYLKLRFLLYDIRLISEEKVEENELIFNPIELIYKCLIERKLGAKIPKNRILYVGIKFEGFNEIEKLINCSKKKVSFLYLLDATNSVCKSTKNSEK